jgi:hypothetical protein
MALQALTKQHTELCATVRTSTLPPPRVWGAGVRVRVPLDRPARELSPPG